MHLLIPSYRRPRVLAATLRHLVGLPLPHYVERIYVHLTGPSEASFTEECSEAAAALELIHGIKVDVEAGFSGLCAAKNAALDKRLDNDLLIIDDDVILTEKYLGRCAAVPHMMEIEARRAKPRKLGLYSGVHCVPMDRGYRQWSAEARTGLIPAYAQSLDVAEGKIDYGDKVQVYRWRDFEVESHYFTVSDIGVQQGYLIGGALWVSRHVNSRFDLHFDRNTPGEELDYSLTVFDEGFDLVFDPAIEFYHFPAATGGSRASAARRNEIIQSNFAYLAEKHNLGTIEDFDSAKANNRPESPEDDTRIYAFDYDNTLRMWEGKHSRPNADLVALTQELKRDGHSVLVYTARNRNSEAKEVRRWLTSNEVAFDEVIFDKPIADVYIDDKAINAYRVTCKGDLP